MSDFASLTYETCTQKVEPTDAMTTEQRVALVETA